MSNEEKPYRLPKYRRKYSKNIRTGGTVYLIGHSNAYQYGRLGDLDTEVSQSTQNELAKVYIQGFNGTPSAPSDATVPPPIVLNPSQMPLAMVALAVDVSNRLTAPHSNILRRVNDTYRELQGLTTGNAMARGLTRVQASQQFLNKLADKGLTSFVDTNGRQWNMGSYAEMVMRTNAAHFYREGFLDSQAAYGNSLVYVSKHIGACELCTPWEGKILRIADTEERAERVKNMGFTVGESDAIINQSGAKSLMDIQLEKDASAIPMYEDIRKCQGDTEAISDSTIFNSKAIEEIRQHMFFTEHQLTGGLKPFDPDFDQASAWNRLVSGTHSELDVMMLKHEYVELTQMRLHNYNYEQAHKVANRYHNWYKAIGGE
ncbi:hypothetical protein AGMMS49975_22820 [Clostridia bacterium]|nr:hypothetical protein AGMMS49975_22820 [Clostridia bacterium]